MNRNRPLHPLPTEQWDNSLEHVIEDMKGDPINVHKLMAHNPALLNAWWNFRNYSVTGGALGKRRGELVILRVAIHMRAWYEWGSHVERGLACGLTLEEIERVKREPRPELWSEKEYLLLIAVDELVDRHGLSAELLTKLQGCYSDAELMDLIAIHGMYVILGCMINTWGLELDQRVEAKLPDQVSRSAFETEFPREP
ncbi:carboxymuconolactone decarboxylase family protein [Marinobacterium sp. D7]|uniref:carboxymuconolactone decarboxylase family protein n=1 Tax=Marinobacterium ramblicola TaxID=2849041 RepID=UPI001C2CFB3B|nr:carboxymuconolactone decarboxylase family protein [Marinobacterium ramblicola]MBV1789288.1 carboxymuconolactone decarboxylase family protein [Marinobacterium ramblicola]